MTSLLASRSVRALRALVALAALSAVAAVAARAQSVTTGAISGVARSDSARILTGVDVVLSQREAGAVCRTTTDAAGTYRCTELAPGRYDVYAEKLGFRPLQVLDVIVSAASRVTLDLTLAQAEPPITSIDTVFFSSSCPSRSALNPIVAPFFTLLV